MTCAKREVTCIIFDKEHRRFAVGTNACAKPQEVCPREDGEGYKKCRTICQQSGHAEMVALDAFFTTHGIRGAYVAYVIGHDHACPACEGVLEAFGIRIEVLGNRPCPACEGVLEVFDSDTPRTFPGTILAQQE